MLQKDGRASVAQLARAVGRSESVVRERIGAMEAEGLVKGYHAEIDWARAGLPAHVLLQAKCDLRKVDEVTDRLAAIPNVTLAMLVTGDRPILAHLQVRDIQHLSDLLHQHFSDAGFSPEAMVVLQPLVEARAPALPAAPPFAASPPAGPAVPAVPSSASDPVVPASGL